MNANWNLLLVAVVIAAIIIKLGVEFAWLEQRERKNVHSQLRTFGTQL
jgi:hypothetical protein